MASQVKPMAWVTLATTDAYALGALVLAHSLRQAGTAHQVVIMVTPGVSQQMRAQLAGPFDSVIAVDVMDSGDAAHLALMARPELGVTLTKLHCWTLRQFSKCVFLDADCLVMTNCDELFEREELSAAPDIGWPDCFNSGVFVFTPSDDTFNALVRLAAETGSFDGGDQGLLNTYFSDWSTRDIGRHLPFLYNMTASAAYTYLPAFRRFGRDVKIVHFLGAHKPWTSPEHADPGSPTGRFHCAWWDVYHGHVRPAAPQFVVSVGSEDGKPVDSATSELVSGMGRLQMSPPSADEAARRGAWERGQMDYMGSDSFENILNKINHTLSNK
ncbi:LOW QUALITY PROTEIN: glycogenin-1-like [Pollicipes pollicipes]|uniref:LOW QUALITY PROTEIN: glycogenin-1-like n=1 Tax=Pollicipes pollicipes TaxID=41117 RepID=UPI0018854DA3|nr:LOW QUALITY PROTEIN: glycogenin-1-like [Pollicipes pollicipes]